MISKTFIESQLNEEIDFFNIKDDQKEKFLSIISLPEA